MYQKLIIYTELTDRDFPVIEPEGNHKTKRI
jgi:hypothetical protein